MPRILLLYTDADFYSGTHYDRAWRTFLEAEGCEVHVASGVAAVAGPDAPPPDAWDLVIPHVLIEEVTAFAPTFRAAALLEGLGVPLLNGVRALMVSSDKRLTHGLWAAHGLPQPATWPLDEIDGWPAPGRPLVLKPALGEAGRDAELVRDLEHARSSARGWRDAELRDGKPRGDALLQEWIEDPACLRVYATADGAQDRAYEKLRSPGTLVSDGGYRIVPLDAEVAELARRMVATLGGGLMGVDVLVGRDGRPRALEANAAFAFALEDPAQGAYCAREAVRAARRGIGPTASRAPRAGGGTGL